MKDEWEYPDVPFFTVPRRGRETTGGWSGIDRYSASDTSKGWSPRNEIVALFDLDILHQLLFSYLRKKDERLDGTKQQVSYNVDYRL
jgi:hypothetical protein